MIFSFFGNCSQNKILEIVLNGACAAGDKRLPKCTDVPAKCSDNGGIFTCVCQEGNFESKAATCEPRKTFWKHHSDRMDKQPSYSKELFGRDLENIVY